MATLFSKKDIQAPALTYGRTHEASAKDAYLKMNDDCHLHECGFIVSNQMPFLGATPDGVVCKPGGQGIIEIKCPYSARNMTIKEACRSLKNFCLTEDENQEIHLKDSHEYYAQIQGQLMITGAEYCELIVYTSKDLFVQNITPNNIYVDNLLVTLCNFYAKYAVDYLSQTTNH